MERNEIIKLAEKHNFMIEGRDWALNQSGLDFSVVQFEDENGVSWILRIPRREDVQDQVLKEKRILDVVVPNLKVQAPKWELVNDELIAYKALRGVPVGTYNPEVQQFEWGLDPKNLSDRFVSSLAEAMVSLHSISFDKVREGGLPVQSISEVRNQMQQRMDRVKEEMDVADKLWSRWKKWIDEDSYWPEQSGFIHGDLHAGHMLIDKQERVTGFIDWTEARVADVSTDFLGHLVAYGEAELDRLILAYGQAGGKVWPNMKEHIMELATTTPIDIAEFAIKSDSEEYMEMARKMLQE
ncbi:macrolide 2'-phosphotransferase [Planococcus soli]|uniref:macrolide 2'-phosphotransferase n=1 Tax=Planococcus soli TaxID=2666072 RepID=UPI00115D3A71|nr:macrolide 2'-phosphotransferase [Planococcus soli]